MKRLGPALSVLFLCLPLVSQESAPVEPCAPMACRPLFSTSAGLAEPGVLELEVGVQRISNRNRSEDTCFPVQLNLGVSTWFDLRFGWSGPMLRRDSQGDSHQGGGDPVVGGQALLLNQGTEGLDLGLAYWHKVPRASVSKGIGTGKHDDTLLLTASQPLHAVVFSKAKAVSESKLGFGRGTASILRRDGHRCQYVGCSRRATTVDHVVPRCQGGTNTWNNLVACCLECNALKGGRTPEQAGMQLRSAVRSQRALLMERFHALTDE